MNRNSKVIFLIFLMFLLFLISFCTSPSNPERGETQPTIQLLGNANPINHSADFLIQNNTLINYYYEGYDPDFPSTHIEMLADTGWASVEPNWCGTGLVKQTLKPEQKLPLGISCSQKYDKWRVAIYFQKSSESEFIKVVSDVVDF